MRGIITVAPEEEDGMASDFQFLKTLQQYLTNPELLTEENIKEFSLKLRYKGREMKLHRENLSARARLLHELGLKDLVCTTIKNVDKHLTLHDVVQLACAIGCSVDISISPGECAEESICVAVKPADGLGVVFDGHRDLWETIRNKGELVASQEWDSGGPGAGAGEVDVYEYNGRFFVFHGAGASEYETLYEARVNNGFKPKGKRKVAPKPVPPSPIFEKSDDDGSWDRAESHDNDDFGL